LQSLIKSPSINYINLDIPFSNVSSVEALPVNIISNHSSSNYYDLFLDIPVYKLMGLNNSNFSNILFKYKDGQNIHAWIQSYNRSNLDVWLNISNMIEGNETIYLAIYNKSTNFFSNNGYTGEAPELSPIYGEYNDAKSVFPYSIFFMNTSDANKLAFSPGTHYVIDDGLTVYAGSNYSATSIPCDYSPYTHGLIYSAYFASNSTLDHNPGSLLSFTRGGIQLNGLTYFSGHYYINMNQNGTTDLLSPPIPLSNISYNDFYEQVSNNNSEIIYDGHAYYFNITYGTNISGQTNIGLFALLETLHVRYVIVTLRPIAPVSYEFGNLTVERLIDEQTIVERINNISALGTPLFIKDNPNGYIVCGKFGYLNIVRYEYYKGMIPDINRNSIIPIMGGINYVVVSNGHIKQVTFTSDDYYLLLFGVSAYLAVIFIPISMVLYDYFRKRRDMKKNSEM
jgi:hypothetical protein